MSKSNALLTLGATNHSKEIRQAEDFYATDPKSLEMLLDALNKENFKFSNNIWEPACGTGWLSKVMEDRGHNVKNSDIIERCELNHFELLDFMSLDASSFRNTYDIITNPPYKMTTKFVKQALDISEPAVKIAMFLRLTFLEGKERRKIIFDKEPPRYVLPFTARALVAKDGIMPNGSAVAYAWFVWEKGWNGKPEIIWL